MLQDCFGGNTVKKENQKYALKWRVLERVWARMKFVHF